MAEIIEISRAALHEQVADRLRSMLIEGRIAPGAKLNERELCEQLGVSRTPLREAIKLLAAEGDRKSTRLNSSHSQISYAVFCLKKKKKKENRKTRSLKPNIHQNYVG